MGDSRTRSGRTPGDAAVQDLDLLDGGRFASGRPLAPLGLRRAHRSSRMRATSVRERLRAQLPDLKMPGAFLDHALASPGHIRRISAAPPHVCPLETRHLSRCDFDSSAS